MGPVYSGGTQFFFSLGFWGGGGGGVVLSSLARSPDIVHYSIPVHVGGVRGHEILQNILTCKKKKRSRPNLCPNSTRNLPEFCPNISH